MPPWPGKHLLKSIMESQRLMTPDMGKEFDMYRTEIAAYIGSQGLVFFDMATRTVKSFKEGTNITLKKAISCPDNGEGLI